MLARPQRLDYNRAMTIDMQPIGWVRSDFKEPVDDCWAGTVVAIELDTSIYTAESLRGLSEFSHA